VVSLPLQAALVVASSTVVATEGVVPVTLNASQAPFVAV
jgi:hypothetical protein